MSDWAFRTWPRILAGAALLSGAFGLLHVLGRRVTGVEARADASTLAIWAMVFVGYLAVAWHLRRNPYPDQE